MRQVTFQSGETVIEQGAINDTFYIIKSGVARVQQVISGSVSTARPGLARGNSSTGSLSRQPSDSRGSSGPSISRQTSSNESLSPTGGASPRYKDVAQLQPGDTYALHGLNPQSLHAAPLKGRACSPLAPHHTPW